MRAVSGGSERCLATAPGQLPNTPPVRATGDCSAVSGLVATPQRSAGNRSKLLGTDSQRVCAHAVMHSAAVQKLAPQFRALRRGEGLNLDGTIHDPV
eukprot:14870923-Alexandrium_andersonii.AAC.1